MNPLVSVIIPVFNGEKYIDDCMKTLSKQTIDDFEVIFIMDSKTSDKSIDIVNNNRFGLKNYQVIIQSDNGGLGYAKNLGVNKSTGKYVWFFDVDDYAYPSLLEELTRIAEEKNADIVFCNNYWSLDGKFPDIPDKQYSLQEFTKEEAIHSFNIFPPHSWSKIQKRTIFAHKETRFRQYRSIEDMEQTYASLFFAEKICYYDKPLYGYNRHNVSASSTNRIKECFVIEMSCRHLHKLYANTHRNHDDTFDRLIVERIMRQTPVSPFEYFEKVYDRSIAHTIIDSLPSKTMEMRFYKFSKRLYYLSIRFAMFVLKRNKKGPWHT